MKRTIPGIITIVSLLFSPLLGGLLGRLIAKTDILRMSSVMSDDWLCIIGSIAWMLASVVFYTMFALEKSNISTQTPADDE